jgi:hypothetical protein
MVQIINSSIGSKSYGKNRKDIYGFFVRKQKRIEGHLIKPVVV